MNLWSTKIALDRYDAVQGEFRAKVGVAAAEEVDRLALALDQATKDVREAFADDTADLGARDRVLLVNPDNPWLRTLVVKYARTLPTISKL